MDTRERVAGVPKRNESRLGTPATRSRVSTQNVERAPLHRGMGILPMNHRQDPDATRPHGQDGNSKRDRMCLGTYVCATLHTRSQRGSWENLRLVSDRPNLSRAVV